MAIADDRSQDFDLKADALLKSLADDSRRFFRELTESNRLLRLRVAGQEERLERLSQDLAEAQRGADRAHVLERENASLARELAGLRERYAEIEFEQQDFSVRYQQIEEQYSVIANLYVAAYQLHSSVLYAEVIAVAKEITANLMGVKKMRLYLRNRANDLLLAAEMDVPRLTGEREGRLHPEAREEPVLMKVLAAGLPYRRPEGERGDPVAVMPLRIRKTVVGLLVIDQLLAHKDRLNESDEQMFELLGGHLAVALARATRKAAEVQAAPSLSDQDFDLSKVLLV
ncbi:MAG: GAF domain-containing protein [Myxococcales bacterium]